MALNRSSNKARECLTFEERPDTPPHLRKFRRSTNLEPGKRFIHPGKKCYAFTL